MDTTYDYNSDIYKSKIIKYKFHNLATMNTVITNINIVLNREENHLHLPDSYIDIEFVVSDNAGGVIAKNANIRLVNHAVMALFSSVKLETTGGRSIEDIDHCHPNLLKYKLLTSTDDEYERGFVRNQGKGDIQLKGDHIAAERDHMYVMVKTSEQFGFVNGLENIIYGLGFKLLSKRNNKDRAIFRVNAGADAEAIDGNFNFRDISWCVPSTDPSNDNRIFVQKGLDKKNNIDFSFYERKTFYNNVPNATNFLFVLGTEFGIERPQYIIIGFEKNTVNEQTIDASTFDIMNVTKCYCKISSEFHPENRMDIYYGSNILKKLWKRFLI